MTIRSDSLKTFLRANNLIGGFTWFHICFKANNDEEHQLILFFSVKTYKEMVTLYRVSYIGSKVSNE